MAYAGCACLAGSRDGPKDPAGNQLHQQLGFVACENQCAPLPISETANPKAISVPTICAGARGVRLSSAALPSAPAPADEKPTSAPTGNISHDSSGLRSRLSRFSFRGGRESELPACRADQNRAKNCIEKILRSCAHKMPKEERPEQNPRRSTQQHESERPPRHIAARNLGWHKNQLDGRGKHQSYANRNRRRHPRNNTRTGTVTVPAPTPVSAINSAITNPYPAYCIPGPNLPA